MRERGTEKIKYMWPQSHTNKRIELRVQGIGNARYKDFQIFALSRVNEILSVVYHCFSDFFFEEKRSK